MSGGYLLPRRTGTLSVPLSSSTGLTTTGTFNHAEGLMEEHSVKKETRRDYTGAKIGMWLFLATEFFLFIGPLILYAAYRHRYPVEFHGASRALDLRTGAVNTVILLTSSLTAALSVSSVRKGGRNLTVLLLAATIVMGAVFLINKYAEWGEKIRSGIYPGSDVLVQGKAGTSVFYGLYFFTTGLHGLHVIAGMVILTVMAFMVAYNRVHETDYVKLENSALYWHLVDIIWIYLFPFFYLVK